MVEETLRIPFDRPKTVAEIHAACRVLEETWDEHGTHLRVRAPAHLLDRFRA
jgi:hypothetical protein